MTTHKYIKNSGAVIRSALKVTSWKDEIPGNIQDQVGQGSEQPDLVSGVPARCGGVGLDDL